MHSRLGLFFGAALVALAAAAFFAGPAMADVERARIEWTGTNDLVDIHVTDAEGNGAAAGFSGIPNTTYVGDNSGERVNSFIDHDDPSTRVFCYTLDNYGSEATNITVTLVDVDGTSRVDNYTLEGGQTLDLGSSPPGLTVNQDFRCAPSSEPPPEPPPEDDIALGRTVGLGLVSGRVRYKVKGQGGFRPLRADTTVPLGSQVDTTKGRVAVTSETIDGGTQTMDFYSGFFKVSQKPSDETNVKLIKSLKTCNQRGKGGGKLWGNGKGRFGSHGKGGSGGARGTIWLTQDRCDGTTLFDVREGSVEVTNFKNGKKTLVNAGEKIVVGPRR